MAERFEAEFVRGCEQGMVEAGIPAEEHAAICSCAYDMLDSSPQRDAVLEQLAGVQGPQDVPPELQAQLIENMSVCTLDYVARAQAGQCAEICDDTGADPEICGQACHCVHRRLREAHPGDEGARWLLRWVYTVEPTPEGDAAWELAAQACTGEGAGAGAP